MTVEASAGAQVSTPEEPDDATGKPALGTEGPLGEDPAGADGEPPDTTAETPERLVAADPDGEIAETVT